MCITIYRSYQDHHHNEHSKRTLFSYLLKSIVKQWNYLFSPLLHCASAYTHGSICASTRWQIVIILLLCEYQEKICGQRSSIMCHVASFLWKCENAREEKKKSRCVFSHLWAHSNNIFVKIHRFLLVMVIFKDTWMCTHCEACIWTQFLWIVKINWKNLSSNC